MKPPGSGLSALFQTLGLVLFLSGCTALVTAPVTFGLMVLLGLLILLRIPVPESGVVKAWQFMTAVCFYQTLALAVLSFILIVVLLTERRTQLSLSRRVPPIELFTAWKTAVIYLVAVAIPTAAMWLAWALSRRPPGDFTAAAWLQLGIAVLLGLIIYFFWALEKRR